MTSRLLDLRDCPDVAEHAARSAAGRIRRGYGGLLACLWLGGWLQLILPADTAAQASFYADRVYRPEIKSVQLHRSGWSLTYPVIGLNGFDRLSLSFDDLSDQVKNFAYTIEHCTADWQPSGLPVEEFLEGFAEQNIQDYALSFNTHTNYVHYKLELPNEEVKFRISGNYVVKVYEDFNPANLVLVRRFSVSESLISIEGRATRPDLDPFREDGQQLNFKVFLGSLQVNDPYAEIRVAIQQNNRWNMSIRNLKPLFVRGSLLDYDHQQGNIFKGGNEYRYADIKSMRYLPEMVERIEYQAPSYHVFLKPDLPRHRDGYFYRQDLNGRFHVEVQEGVRHETEADYVHVHFSLAMNAPLKNGSLHVSGAFNNWACNAENRMAFNPDTRCYEAVVLLKQGLINYEYAFVEEGSKFPDATRIEGSYYQTENDYTVYVYLSSMTSRYDRLIGYQVINSLHGNR